MMRDFEFGFKLLEERRERHDIGRSLLNVERSKGAKCLDVKTVKVEWGNQTSRIELRSEMSLLECAQEPRRDVDAGDGKRKSILGMI